jgi:GNAT superfamily N-acetyltransferase
VSGTGAIEIRPTRPADEPAALALLSKALEWGCDPADRRRFAWEHEENPFGRTLGWGAFAGGRMVGLRHFLRWEFVAGDGSVGRAARPVDTVTHPDHRRRGISRRLAEAALAELPGRGVSFLFNTPNEQSGPGYRSLNWRVVGHWPLAWRPAAATAPWRLVRARGRPERTAPAPGLGLPAAEALGDPARVEGLLARRSRPPGFETRRSAEYLRWRYGAAPLEYRAVLAGADIEDGLAIVRARTRGPLRELLVCELLLPGDGAGRERELMRRLAGGPDVDVVARLGGGLVDRTGFVRAPRHGWTVVARSLAPGAPPPRRAWRLRVGDLELF